MAHSPWPVSRKVFIYSDYRRASSVTSYPPRRPSSVSGREHQPSFTLLFHPSSPGRRLRRTKISFFFSPRRRGPRWRRRWVQRRGRGTRTLLALQISFIIPLNHASLRADCARFSPRGLTRGIGTPDEILLRRLRPIGSFLDRARMDPRFARQTNLLFVEP